MLNILLHSNISFWSWQKANQIWIFMDYCFLFWIWCNGSVWCNQIAPPGLIFFFFLHVSSKFYFDSHAHMARSTDKKSSRPSEAHTHFEALTYWSILCFFGASIINQTDKNLLKTTLGADCNPAESLILNSMPNQIDQLMVSLKH